MHKVLQTAIRERKPAVIRVLFSFITNEIPSWSKNNPHLGSCVFDNLLQLALETGEREIVELVVATDLDLSVLMNSTELLVKFIEMGCLNDLSYLKTEHLLLNTIQKEKIIFIIEYLFKNPHLYQQAILKLLFWSQSKNKLEIFTIILSQISFPLSLLERDYFPQGSNYFHVAAQTGRIGILRLLLSNEMEMINSKNNYGQTPLHFAAYTTQEEIVHLLLSSGCDSTIWDNNGQTPFEIALLQLQKKNWKEDYQEMVVFNEIVSELETHTLRNVLQ
jgi:hypothetical protein